MRTYRPQTGIWIWFVWLCCFFSAWSVLIIAGNHWQTLREHWGIAVAMAAGSYVAGSTPMGGGTVGFPILVLLFHQSPELGRDFSFAVPYSVRCWARHWVFSLSLPTWTVWLSNCFLL
jgi:hypothetical protein